MLTARAWAGLGLAALIAATLYHVIARPPAGPTGGRAPRVLRRAIGGEPESLDPASARSEAALTVLRDLFEGLTSIGPDGRPVLAAADRVTISPDGRTYTFHLRRAARWSNGAPVVAADFVAAWRRLVDPATAAQYSGLLAPLINATAIAAGRAPPKTLGVRAPAAHRLVVQLRHPTPYFLSLVAHPATFPIDPASLAAHGPRFVKPGILVSNGAFVLRRWEFGSHLVAVRNRMYWNDAATRIDRVDYYTTADPAAQLRAFRAGDLDITASIPPDDYTWVEKHLPGRLRVSPELAVYYLGFNLTRPPFARSRKLRRALSMVIDRERLVDSVTGGGERPAYSFVPPGIPGYTPPLPAYAHWTMRRRISRARALIAAAGGDARPLHIELRYNTGELHERIAVAVASMWRRALHVDTTLHAEDYKVLVQDIDRARVTQVFRASWVADYEDPFSFLQVLRGGFGINLPRYASAAYDRSLRRAQAQTDPARRARRLERAEAIMLHDQPVVPLFYYVAKHLVAASVRGWRDNAMDVVYDKDLAVVGTAAR
ncbi:MAG TPA: peptide ABC transporter substrate-binding protein [Steroidobacteraceae bacterium]|nr:peptide ABC transporter substrate-binding protein [Steroidobacteraceae bacterium]